MYSRMIVGWQLATHMRTELPLDSLEMVLWRRGIKKGSGLIRHSDRGSQPGVRGFAAPVHADAEPAGRGRARSE
ncbi:IS3 family transposase, partial [Streptomyces mirabilis]